MDPFFFAEMKLEKKNLFFYVDSEKSILCRCQIYENIGVLDSEIFQGGPFKFRYLGYK